MTKKSAKLFAFLLFTTLTSLAFAGAEGESCNSKGHKKTSASASTINDAKQVWSQHSTDKIAVDSSKTIKNIVASGLVKS